MRTLGGGVGETNAVSRRSKLAVAALIAAFLTVIGAAADLVIAYVVQSNLATQVAKFPILTCLVATILGGISLLRIRLSGGRLTGAYAATGLAVGVVGLAGLIVVIGIASRGFRSF